MPEGAVYVGRPTKWGNPWTPSNTVRINAPGGFMSTMRSQPATIEECVLCYREDVEAATFGYGPKDVKQELAGKDLACWCPLDQPCHADVLLEIANETSGESGK